VYGIFLCKMTIIGAGIGNLPFPTEYSHDAGVSLKRPYRFSRDRSNKPTPGDEGMIFLIK
jgi:hypothetical protein